MLKDILDKMLEWKRWTDENKPEKWGSFFVTIMLVVFMCVWWLIHTCYCYITRYLKPWQKIMGNVWSLIYAAWEFFMLPTPCSILFYVKLYVYDTKGYVVDFYNNIFLFMLCLEGYFWETTRPNCIYQSGVIFFIGIRNVKFNQSLLVDSIVNLMIILPLNERLIREWQYLPGLGGVYKCVSVF
jgi:hypothetical protein